MNTYDNLLSLARATAPYRPPAPATNGHANGKPVAGAADDPLTAERTILDKLEIDVLGEWENGAVEVYSAGNRKGAQIRDVDRLGYARLIQLAGRPAKANVHLGQADVPNLYKMGAVKEAIALVAGQTRLTHRSLLGVGCWRGKTVDGSATQEVVLVGNGEAAALAPGGELERVVHPRRGGLLLNISGQHDWYDFERLAADVARAGDPGWCRDVCDQAVDLFGRWRWEAAPAPKVVVGLVLATWVQSLWGWRPQVAITGSTNSGKSILFLELKDLFGGLTLKLTAQSTAAGVRQSIGTGSQAVLLDEWDSSKSQADILQMLRTSGREDTRAVGTKDQKGIENSLRHICWVAGIMSGLMKAADKNRFIQLEMLPRVDGAQRIMRASPSELAGLGQKLLAISVRHALDAVGAEERLKMEDIQGVDSRVVESYSVPAAALATACGMGPADAESLLIEMLGTVKEIAIESDQDRLIRTILSQHVDAGKSLGRQSVGQLFEAASTSDFDAALTALGKVGISLPGSAYPDSQGNHCVVLAYDAITQHLLWQTDWRHQSVREVLIRIPGAEQTRRRVGGTRQQTITIPSSYFEHKYTAQDPGQQVDSF